MKQDNIEHHKHNIMSEMTAKEEMVRYSDHMPLKSLVETFRHQEELAKAYRWLEAIQANDIQKAKNAEQEREKAKIVKDQNALISSNGLHKVE